uniref:Uncharacterized protein ALNC14_065180 n=1 Tax=Albugo laibachii Nc14 TaxID=890382 RepID=F0WGL1_9STRA|nr:unnamed protein product [Albugo laibachii Nc14]|eukprot:CCA20375.1 unnamed protein product [Albugo laibachii Nc14]
MILLKSVNKEDSGGNDVLPERVMDSNDTTDLSIINENVMKVNSYQSSNNEDISSDKSTPTGSMNQSESYQASYDLPSHYIPSLDEKLAEGIDLQDYRLSATVESPLTASTDEKKRVIVCGAGIVGLLTCYHLAKQGHEVLCVEKEEAVATQSSYCNSAILDPSLYGTGSSIRIRNRSPKPSRWSSSASVRPTLMSRTTISSFFAQTRPSEVSNTDTVILETPKEALVTITPKRNHDDAIQEEESVQPRATPCGKTSKSKWKLNIPIKVEFKTLRDPSFWKWGMNYLLSNGKQRGAENARLVRQLGFYSMEILKEMQNAHGKVLEMEAIATGTVEILTSPNDLDWISKSDRKRHLDEMGVPLKVLDSFEALNEESSLVPEVLEHGALLCSTGTSGDVHKLCGGLYKLCLRLGVMFRFGTEIQEFLCDSKRAFAIQTRNGSLIEGDDFVLALGNSTKTVAKRAGLELNMYPVKGYILSVPVSEGFLPPKRNIYVGGVTLVSPLEGMVRISGRLDFAKLQEGTDGDETERTSRRSSLFSKQTSFAHQQKRIELLLTQAQELFPEGYLNVSKMQTHVGCQLATADDVPLIGHTRIPNISVNGGYGPKGFLLAFGAGALLADVISGRTPELDMSKFAPHRFGAFH